MITNAYLVQELQRLGTSNRAALPHLKTVRRTAIAASEGIVIYNVRDEMELLPHFLKHYREIGVKRFAFVDNGSVDRTLPFLLDQSDFDVFQFEGSFKNSRAGMIWKNLLLLTYLPAKWYFSADADELVVYDGWPNASLDEFSSRMGSKGRSTVIARVMKHRGHIQGSIDDYQKMGIKLEQDPSSGFSYSGSVRFQTPQQFIDRSMIGSIGA